MIVSCDPHYETYMAVVDYDTIAAPAGLRRALVYFLSHLLQNFTEIDNRIMGKYYWGQFSAIRFYIVCLNPCHLA